MGIRLEEGLDFGFRMAMNMAGVFIHGGEPFGLLRDQLCPQRLRSLSFLAARLCPQGHSEDVSKAGSGSVPLIFEGGI